MLCSLCAAAALPSPHSRVSLWSDVRLPAFVATGRARRTSWPTTHRLDGRTPSINHGERRTGCLAEQVTGEKEDVGRPLGESPHEVGPPGGAEGDVDAHAEALLDEAALKVAADAVEHLELEGGGSDALLADVTDQL